jgi:hypothetical protein
MPRFAVIVHVRGPFQEAGGVDVYDGAYTCRFVSADNVDAATVAAKDDLRNDARFLSFRSGSLDGSPRIDIDQVRAAGWFEGRRGVPGYIFYDESSCDEAKSAARRR